jgi:4-diphosphocytidyl-2-C-methyl-D-erythritol kinase
MLIATPPERKPSTGWAYSLLREDEMGKHLDRYEGLLEGIERADIRSIMKNLHNDFELPIGRLYPIIGSIKETMLSEGALGALLAGSGLSVFGIFSDKRAMRRAEEKLAAGGVHCFMTETV